ncbi:hypothetical protein DBV15_04503 [Temnothorax longispinosus]|uniref:Uncharacterized protein n=1 Tax=Temnothorax longispinosus TaxID=300112 RepID=A0A4V3S9U1_9HYME|nr:hypothetical protein DBV15_04503 [Temnothorax longispinosus]
MAPSLRGPDSAEGRGERKLSPGTRNQETGIGVTHHFVVVSSVTSCRFQTELMSDAALSAAYRSGLPESAIANGLFTADARVGRALSFPRGVGRTEYGRRTIALCASQKPTTFSPRTTTRALALASGRRQGGYGHMFDGRTDGPSSRLTRALDVVPETNGPTPSSSTRTRVRTYTNAYAHASKYAETEADLEALSSHQLSHPGSLLNPVSF